MLRSSPLRQVFMLSQTAVSLGEDDGLCGGNHTDMSSYPSADDSVVHLYLPTSPNVPFFLFLSFPREAGHSV